MGSSEDNARSFVAFDQLFLGKTAMTLKSTELVAYPVHAVHVNASLKRRELLIRKGHTLMGFLPVC